MASSVSFVPLREMPWCSCSFIALSNSAMPAMKSSVALAACAAAVVMVLPAPESGTAAENVGLAAAALGTPRPLSESATLTSVLLAVT